MTYNDFIKQVSTLAASQGDYDILDLLPRIIFTNDVDTMATNGKNIFVSPSFADSLTPEQVIGVLLHESLHEVYGHTTGAPWAVYDRSSGLTPQEWHHLVNMAEDVIINDRVREWGKPLPEGGAFRETLKIPNDLLTSHEIFLALKEDYIKERQDVIDAIKQLIEDYRKREQDDEKVEGLPQLPPQSMPNLPMPPMGGDGSDDSDSSDGSQGLTISVPVDGSDGSQQPQSSQQDSPQQPDSTQMPQSTDDSNTPQGSTSSGQSDNDSDKGDDSSTGGSDTADDSDDSTDDSDNFSGDSDSSDEDDGEGSEGSSTSSEDEEPDEDLSTGDKGFDDNGSGSDDSDSDGSGDSDSNKSDVDNAPSQQDNTSSNTPQSTDTESQGASKGEGQQSSANEPSQRAAASPADFKEENIRPLDEVMRSIAQRAGAGLRKNLTAVKRPPSQTSNYTPQKRSWVDRVMDFAVGALHSPDRLMTYARPSRRTPMSIGGGPATPFKGYRSGEPVPRALFYIDVSGSMGSKPEAIRQVLAQKAPMLGKTESLVVPFGDEVGDPIDISRPLPDRYPFSRGTEIMKVIDDINNTDGVDVYAVITDSDDDFSTDYINKNKHVVFVTDHPQNVRGSNRPNLLVLGVPQF